jgi:cbb3-type cytochrome oxidase maturation protein
MDILYLLIPVSVVLVFLIGAVFWWSLRHGQFEDMEGPAYRILMDDDSPSAIDGGVASKPKQDDEKP